MPLPRAIVIRLLLSPLHRHCRPEPQLQLQPLLHLRLRLYRPIKRPINVPSTSAPTTSGTSASSRFRRSAVPCGHRITLSKPAPSCRCFLFHNLSQLSLTHWMYVRPYRSYVVTALQTDPQLHFSRERLRALLSSEAKSWLYYRDWFRTLNTQRHVNMLVDPPKDGKN